MVASHYVVERPYTPAEVATIDLAEPLPSFEHAPRARLVALVRIGPRPLGVVAIDDRPGPDKLRAAIGDQLDLDLDLVLAGGPTIDRAESAPPSSRPSTAIVIATRDRPGELANCLDSLRDLTLVPDQVVVVDNASGDDRTRAVVEGWRDERLPSIDYVAEPTPGLARAHNTGLTRVTTDVAAFTDDDVLVDRFWLAEVMAGFDGGSDVGCVTGMIFPAELETWAQQWAEDNIGFNKGFSQARFDLATDGEFGPLHPFNAGRMGSGANMSFRIAALDEIGGFDEALGAGTLAKGGDDLHAFYSVVAAGGTLVYQPSSIVHHHHHRTMDGLLRQYEGYGTGLTAYLTSIVVNRPIAAASLARRSPAGVAWLRDRAGPDGDAAGRDEDPDEEIHRQLRAAQRRGMLRGPMAYLSSLRANGR